MLSAILTQEEKVDELTKFYDDCAHCSPWSQYFNLNWSSVENCLMEKGYEEAWEMINRADKRAYHAEEAACGCI